MVVFKCFIDKFSVYFNVLVIIVIVISVSLPSISLELLTNVFSRCAGGPSHYLLPPMFVFIEVCFTDTVSLIPVPHCQSCHETEKLDSRENVTSFC